MAIYDKATIEILNWDKFCPRKDLKATSWLRLQNTLLSDPKFMDFSHAELIAWIYLLSLASLSQKATIQVFYTHAERIGRLTATQMDGAIEKLIELQCVHVSVRTRHADDTATTRTRHTTNERTNVTNETERNETNERKTLCGGGPEKTSASGAKAPAATALNRAIWEAYREAYLARHGEEPLRNAQVNSLIAAFGRKVSGEEAPEIAASYVRHNDSLYVRGRHPLELLVRDAQRIRTDWKSGSQMTGGLARGVERKQDIYAAWAPVIAEAEARDGK